MQKLSMGISEWLLLITLSVLWGGSFFLIKIALKDLPPLTVVLYRVSLAAIALTIFVFMSRKRMPASLSLWREFLVMGALNNLIPFSLIVWGQTQINSSLAAILNATTPLFTILLAHFFTKDERLTPNRLVGVFLGLCGVIVLIGLNTLHGLSLNSLGQLAILGAACSYGCAGIYGRRFKTLPATVTAVGMLLSTTILLLPLVLLVDRPWTLHLSTVTKLAVLGLSLFSTAIAYLIYFRILAVAGATNLLLVTFLIPISALVLGIFVLGEQLQWTEFGGMVLIFASLAVIDGRLISRLWHPTSEI
ncbi:DMT family transporter [Chlorogloeopsis fritschii PCC 9212]|uniref:ABC transporter permease n=1 Tax=Chlorogloeopsis fritschii PCC 6912 TaxID=211165 RepID=A0A433N206_CHLFR|nr:DMT family transporter [Chlorogloeopsis fritschii]RUR75102.1 ABC transporter permease [Chlorogloeopsis fritschii PCC 6912]